MKQMQIKKYFILASAYTLIEVMLALVIGFIIIAALYKAFLTQQHSYIVQDNIVEMQQNLRAAIIVISRDLRMAGYDPTETSDATFEEASIAKMGFSFDLNGDGDTGDANEKITYQLNSDSDHDGIVDDGKVSTIGRQTGSGVFQPLAENIEAVEFTYFDAAGTAIPTPVAAGRLQEIRTVRINILARTVEKDLEYTDNSTYITASGQTWGPFNDHYRRFFESTTVICRNMGL